MDWANLFQKHSGSPNWKMNNVYEKKCNIAQPIVLQENNQLDKKKLKQCCQDTKQPNTTS